MIEVYHSQPRMDGVELIHVADYDALSLHIIMLISHLWQNITMLCTLQLLQYTAGRKIRLGEENIELFYETLKADVNLLASLNIMDYSLLVCIF